MGIALELPILYLFLERDILKRIILDLDMNLLFFPEFSTLNLFDFTVCGEYRFKHFSAGIQFGAHTVITSEQVVYIWKTGLNFKIYF